MNTNNNTNTNNNNNKTEEHCDTVTISKDVFLKIMHNAILLEAIASIHHPGIDKLDKKEGNKVYYTNYGFESKALSKAIENEIFHATLIKNLFAKETAGDKTPPRNFIETVLSLAFRRHFLHAIVSDLQTNNNYRTLTFF